MHLKRVIEKFKNIIIMKNVIYSSIIVVSVVFFTSCEKDGAEDVITNNNSPLSNMMNMASPPHIHNIVISSILLNNDPSQIDVTGEFISGNGNFKLVEGLTVGGKDIPGTAQERHSYHVSSSDSDFDNYYNLIKESPDIEFENNESTFSTTLENPEPPIYSLSAASIMEIPRDAPLEITWNTDDDNTSGKVAIALISRGMDLGQVAADSTKNISFNTITDDDGNFTIPVNELSQFYPGNYVDILVARGKEELMDDNETLVTAVSSNFTLGKMKSEAN